MMPIYYAMLLGDGLCCAGAFRAYAGDRPPAGKCHGLDSIEGFYDGASADALAKFARPYVATRV